MTDIALSTRYKIDVKNGLITQPMAGMLMKGDKNANRIIAALFDGDKKISLDGVTVTGKFFRGGDGIEITLAGEVSDNEASILLDEHCYAMDGYFEASIKLQHGEDKRTILTVAGQVISDGDGGILDIENVIPSIADIVAQYKRMQEVTTQTEAARDQAISASLQAARFKVLDLYATYDAMIAAHPTGEAGQAYAVGTEDDNVVYIWGVDVLAWVCVGSLKGETGPRGKDANLSDNEPKPMGSEANAGTSDLAARDDHVHAMPSAADVGALAKDGTAADSSKLGGVTSSEYVRAGHVLTVGPGCRFATINAAIAAARAICTNDNRVLIRIMPGVYEEEIILNPNPGIDFEGDDWSNTMIRYPSVYPNAPVYTCGQGSFRGLTIYSNCPDGEAKPSYGVHVEYQVAPDAGGVVCFEHCKLQGRRGAAIGAGLGENAGVQLLDCLCISETTNAVYTHGYPESNVSGQTFTAHRCDFRSLSGGNALHVDDVNGIYGLSGSELTVECVACMGSNMVMRTAENTFQGYVPSSGDVRLSAFSTDNEFIGANYGDLYNGLYVVCMRSVNAMLFIPWQDAHKYALTIQSVLNSSGIDVTVTVSLHSNQRNGFLLSTTSTDAGPYWVQAVVYPGM